MAISTTKARSVVKRIPKMSGRPTAIDPLGMMEGLVKKSSSIRAANANVAKAMYSPRSRRAGSARMPPAAAHRPMAASTPRMELPPSTLVMAHEPKPMKVNWHSQT